MKKSICIMIALFFAVTSIMTGNAIAKVIMLKVATTHPPMGPAGVAIKGWTEKIEKVSNGRVKFKIFYASSLFSGKDTLRAVMAGLADISDFWHLEGPRQYPLSYLGGNMPGIDWPDSQKSTKIWRELIKEFPEFYKQYMGLKLLYPKLIGETMYIHTKDKSVKTLSDMKGLKMLGPGFLAKWLKYMGATPVSIPFEDTYMSIERGLIDGGVFPWGVLSSSGSFDMVNNHTSMETPFLMIFDLLVMNPDSYKKLPTDIQKIFDDVDEYMTKLRIKTELKGKTKYVPDAKQKGHHFYKLSAKDKKVVLDACKPLHETQIQLAEKKGYPGRKFYNAMIRKIQEAK